MVRRMHVTLRALGAAMATFVLAAGAQPVVARTTTSLAAVPAQRSCASLANLNESTMDTGKVTIAAATVTTTTAKQFCEVRGTIAAAPSSAINFQVHLPLTKWTQRYVQVGCGGLCGNVNVAIDNASGCAPALNGEFVVAANDMGAKVPEGGPMGSFATDPEKRIDFAYRGNHVTALVAKSLIRAFYGRQQRYAYFTGCSDGGREGLMEAQRYPDDFDGVSAGAPAMNFQVQNSFYHAWMASANLDAAGKPILLAAKLPVLHAAVLAHCDAIDGLRDGLLSDPRACRVDTDWVACKPGATATDACLTAREAAIVRRIYDGPRAPDGRSFLVGGPQPGSELQWDFIPASATDRSMSAMLGAAMRRYMIFPQSPAPNALVDDFSFDARTFAEVTKLHGLNDATNPDLRPFARHGGRMILWHGWSDTSISPMTSIAYYKAVQQLMGARSADAMLRLFMLPGTGHCGGGDGFAQVDTLTPLMAWVEAGHAPAQLTADKVADLAKGPRGGLPGADQSGKQLPLPSPAATVLARRTIYPFPAIPRPGRSGNVAGKSVVIEQPVIDWYGADLFRPGFQRAYRVSDDKLVVHR